MSITTQVVGTLGSKGYLFVTTQPKTYALPPNPSGWSIVVIRWPSSGYISFKCTNRITGETVWDYHQSAPSVTSRGTSQNLLEAARVGMNFEIRNNLETRICIASGVEETPPTA